MELFSLSSHPPDIPNGTISLDLDKNSRDYIIKSEMGDPVVIKNCFESDGFDRMVVFSEKPLFDKCYLVEGWFEHARGGTAGSNIQIVDFSISSGFVSIYSTFIDRMLNYAFVFDKQHSRLIFLAHGSNKNFQAHGKGGLLTIKNPLIEWCFPSPDTKSGNGGKNFIEELSIPIQSIGGDRNQFLNDLPVSLDWVISKGEENNTEKNTASIQLKVYSAYEEIVSIQSDPVFLDRIIQ